MAVGDDARAAGYVLVPDTGEEGKVKWGAREINRTRDYVAQLKNMLPAGSKDGARKAAGITSGTTNPDNKVGNDGDIYFKIV
jgi:hypothetical protein